MSEVEALRSALRQNSPDGFLFEKPSAPNPALSYAIWRFLKAWNDNKVLGPDHAVLLRQIARWSKVAWHIGSCPPDLTAHFGKTHVAFTNVGALHAEPFRPSWLTNDVLPVGGIDAAPTLRQSIDQLPAESYASHLGYVGWRSLAQKEAAWLALSAHPGQTTLIVLPTGMGKSLCFQLLPLFGTGLTVVVVPTVALAIDQYRSALQVFENAPGVNPLYFAAQDPDIDPESVIYSIDSGKCRIVFTSPEACVSGRLRKVIEDTATDGRLENLVIDEAHLVDTWGAFFRVDFQILAGLRRRWLHLNNGRFRTLLLSATITPSCRATLNELFPSIGSTKDQDFLCQQVRPEMVYHDRSFETEQERNDAIVECAWQLPRPTIIYTTEVDDAKALHDRLRYEHGFLRTGCFHGDTPPRQRRQLLTQWRNDELDLMIATSAFGLGVDKPDVRAVVHACYPEDLNRYYQEVGRGGRDGYSSTCVLLPTSQDYFVAKGLSPKLMTDESVQRRWEALWKSRQPVKEDDHIWKLCLNSKRQTLIGVRTWSENVRWNKRLILQLLRARKIELLNAHYLMEDGNEDPTEWVEVRLQSQFSPDSPHVGDSIADQRDEEIGNSRRGLGQVAAYLKSDKCISRILRDLYGENTRRICGGCRWCRRVGRPPGVKPRVEFDVGRQCDVVPHVTIVENCPSPSVERPRAFLSLLRRCIEEKGIRRFAATGDICAKLLPLFASALAYRNEQRYRIDDVQGEQPFLLGPDEPVVAFHLDAVSPSAARLDRGSDIIHVLAKGLSFKDIRYHLPTRCTTPVLHATVEQWLM